MGRRPTPAPKLWRGTRAAARLPRRRIPLLVRRRNQEWWRQHWDDPGLLLDDVIRYHSILSFVRGNREVGMILRTRETEPYVIMTIIEEN